MTFDGRQFIVIYSKQAREQGMYYRDEKIFTPTKDQGYIILIEGRIGSLNANKPTGYTGEVKRMTFALADVLSRMSEEDVTALRAHQNKVLTPREIEEARIQMNKRMEENRDKPSI